MMKFLKIYVVGLMLFDFVLLMFLVLSHNIEISEPQAAAVTPTVLLSFAPINRDTSIKPVSFSTGEKFGLRVNLEVDPTLAANGYKSFELKMQYDKRYLELDGTDPITQVPGTLVSTSTDITCAAISTNHGCITKSFTLPGSATFGANTFIGQVNFKVKEMSARTITDILASDTLNKGIQFFSQVDSTKGIQQVTKSANSTISIGAENWCLGDYNRTLSSGKIVDLNDLSAFAKKYIPPNVLNYSTITTENGKLKINKNKGTESRFISIFTNTRELTNFTTEVTIDKLGPNDTAYRRADLVTTFQTNSGYVNKSIGKVNRPTGVELMYWIGETDKYKKVEGLTADSPLYVKIEYVHPKVKLFYRLSTSVDYTLLLEESLDPNVTYKSYSRLHVYGNEVTALFDDFKYTGTNGFNDDFSGATFKKGTNEFKNPLNANGQIQNVTIWGDFDLVNTDQKNEINLQDLVLFAANYGKTTCTKFRSNYL